MTKQQEINVLRNAVTALGPDSYLGSWLASNIAEIENDIRCDVFPTASFSADLDAIRRAEATVRGITKQLKIDAEKRAVEILENARAEARTTLDSVAFRCENIKHSAVAACREAINNLTR